MNDLSSLNVSANLSQVRRGKKNLGKRMCVVGDGRRSKKQKRVNAYSCMISGEICLSNGKISGGRGRPAVAVDSGSSSKRENSFHLYIGAFLFC